jgi:general secretion pathway protein J
MTLAETLLAVFLVAMMMTLVWGGFAQSFDSKEELERQLDSYEGVRMAMTRMVRDLSMAYISRNIPTTGERRVKTMFQAKDERPVSRVVFASLSHMRLYKNSHESDQCEITYFGSRDVPRTTIKSKKADEKRRAVKDQGLYNLMRRESRRLDDEPERGGVPHVVAENVKKVELRYWDGKDCKEDCWKDSWDTESIDGQPDRLPERIKIAVTIVDEHGKDLTLTTQTKVMMYKDPVKY